MQFIALCVLQFLLRETKGEREWGILLQLTQQLLILNISIKRIISAGLLTSRYSSKPSFVKSYCKCTLKFMSSTEWTTMLMNCIQATCKTIYTIHNLNPLKLKKLKVNYWWRKLGFNQIKSAHKRTSIVHKVLYNLHMFVYLVCWLITRLLHIANLNSLIVCIVAKCKVHFYSLYKVEYRSLSYFICINTVHSRKAILYIQ